MHLLTPFLLDMEDDPDMTSDDLYRAIREDAARQALVERWLRGEIPYEAILDMVADNGVDAHEYDELVETSVDRLIIEATPLDCAELLLGCQS
jgi:hypothetical protein